MSSAPLIGFAKFCGVYSAEFVIVTHADLSWELDLSPPDNIFIPSRGDNSFENA